MIIKGDVKDNDDRCGGTQERTAAVWCNKEKNQTEPHRFCSFCAQIRKTPEFCDFTGFTLSLQDLTHGPYTQCVSKFRSGV